MKYLKFDCGCMFEMSDEGQVKFNLSTDDLNYNCKETWKLISQGNTKGVFQVESQLGKQLCKSAPVESINDLAAIVAIARPGCMNAFIDGKSLTNIYLDRRAGKEEVEYFHPALEPYLKKTYGVLIYQENVLAICQGIAGMTIVDSVKMVKAGAKKNTQLMAEMKKVFLDGCKTTKVVNDHDAEQIMSWIEAGQRYLFSAIHACGYAYISYACAYAKAHFPQQFFTSWLSFAGDKPKRAEEICELVNNAKQMKFDVLKPDFRLLNQHFKLKNDVIYFGFQEIKGIGEASFTKTIATAQELEVRIGGRDKWSYLDLLILFLPKINSVVAKAMINCGALDYISTKRAKLSYELDCFTKLSPKEIEWVEANYKAYVDLRGVLGGLYDLFKFKVKTRKPKVLEIINSLEKPPYSLEDTAMSIAAEEKRLLGIALSCSPVDSCDTSEATHTCQDWTTAKIENAALAVHIDNIKEFTIKRGNFAGKRMAKLTVSDSSGTLDVVAFTDTWAGYKNLLTAGNTVLLSGLRNKKDGNFIVNMVKQI